MVPCTHWTRSAYGLRRAISRDARAGSSPVTLYPCSASRQAKVPVPQPMSSTSLLPNSATIAT